MRILLALALLGYIYAERTFKITADNYLEVHVDGVKLLDRIGRWENIKSVNPTRCYTSVAVEAEAIGGVSMVIATFDDGTVTDSSWKVTTELQDGWTDAFFDDSAWENVYEIGQKATYPSWGAYLKPGIDNNAYYIWTENFKYDPDGDHLVYIRKTFNDCRKYDCDKRNPCDSLQIPGRYYYAHFVESKFVQCDTFGQCFEMDCKEGDIWDDEALTCVPK